MQLVAYVQYIIMYKLSVTIYIKGNTVHLSVSQLHGLVHTCTTTHADIQSETMWTVQTSSTSCSKTFETLVTLMLLLDATEKGSSSDGYHMGILTILYQMCTVCLLFTILPVYHGCNASINIDSPIYVYKLENYSV